MKTAIVHYWLTGMRGGEKTLEALCEMFPGADIFTHVYAPEKISAVINSHKITTSFINRLPFAGKLYKKYLPLMPRALLDFDLQDYDLIISSEAGPAKGVIARPDAHHICYCHSPMRYIWDASADYYKSSGALTKFFMKIFLPSLRVWDITSGNLVDRFIANSNWTALRVRRYYKRSSSVIFPPADVEKYISRPRAPEDFYLVLGEITPYKRVDIALDACAILGRRLIVAGGGRPPLRSKRRGATNAYGQGMPCPYTAAPPAPFSATPQAGGFAPRNAPQPPPQAGGGAPRAPNCGGITFTGRVCDECAADLLSRARALLFPGVEDLGLVPVEAQAAGCPVIAFRGGGALDTVLEGETGVFFDEQNAASLVGAILRFEESEARYQEREVFNAQARKFSREAFKEQMRRVIDERRYVL